MPGGFSFGQLNRTAAICLRIEESGTLESFSWQTAEMNIGDYPKDISIPEKKQTRRLSAQHLKKRALMGFYLLKRLAPIFTPRRAHPHATTFPFFC